MKSEMTIEEARALVENELLNSEVPCVVVDEFTIVKPWGWVFFYDTKQYLETRDDRYLIAGNAPYIVNRQTGKVHSTGTAQPIEHYIEAYESELKDGAV